MEPLFDKTYDELREAFVRARFAEPAMFGRPDIEEWLYSQRENLNQGIDLEPWESSAFDNFMHATWDHSGFNDSSVRATRLLREFVTAGGRPADSSDPRFDSVLKAFQSAGIEIYFRSIPSGLLEEPFGMIILDDNTYSIIGNNEQTDSEVARLDTAMVGEVKYLMMEEVRLGRPKATQALVFLLSQYRLAIANTRNAAQRDFDEAVAVSADGTKIVKAKWVVVGSNGGAWKNRVILFPAEAFRGQKIQSYGKGAREGINMSHLGGLDLALEGGDLVANLLQDLFRNMTKGRSPWNTYLEDETGRDIFESLYLADLYSCPSPLPQGGREIRI